MMGLDRSPNRRVGSASNSLCSICQADISSANAYTTTCQHEFHRECIEAHWKNSEKCPVCESACRATASKTAEKVARETRSRSKATQPVNNPLDEGPSTSIRSSSNNTNSSIITANAVTLLAMERRMLATLSEKMSELIQNAFSESVNRVTLTPSPAQPQLQDQVPGVFDRIETPRSPASQRTVASELLTRPDKVVHILNGWKIKFSGESMSVDNFIYRVEALTRQMLDGNFTVLCRNCSVLFEGKANEFYWRYHKAYGEISWEDFCAALRLQFRHSRDDNDIEEIIRTTKQKPNESFDSFYDNISGLIDQLEQPWVSSKLVRVLKSNLRPEIRHEILNLEIKTVSELREICRRREAFLADVKRCSGYTKVVPFRREVAEFGDEMVDLQESEPEGEAGVEAFSLKCWNCQSEGHRYQDCLSERRVFCYGCGAANTYKPSCSKCSKNFKQGISKSQYKQKTSYASRNQSTMTDQ